MKQLLPRIMLAAAMTITAAHAQTDAPRFYRGDYDDQKAEAPNGAIVNDAYRKFITEGPFSESKIFEPRDGVWSIVGYSLSNYTFIKGETGLIAFDTGNNIGMGQQVLELLRTKTNLPIVAIIYSHHHYTGGAAAYAEEGKGDIPVYGHPDLDANLVSTGGALGPMQFRRSAIQLGFYLPHDGPDAVFGPAEPTFDEPALNANGHLPVTHPMTDGEEAVIDGLRVVFHHAVADTQDSLIVHFPDLDLVLHNTAVTPNAFSMYTLRGDFYREPHEMIGSIDKMRALRPEIMIGCHGDPVVGADDAYEIMTAHRDYYAFVYNQSVRAINLGMTPNEMAHTIRIPKHLAEHPWLYPGYVDSEYNIRGIYRGMVGWYAEDTAELHPPTDAELGSVVTEGFGGADKLIARGQVALDERKYNLAARLMSYVLDADPENADAGLLKAKALRAMAQATRAGIQTRNFLLTHALHLEGKLDWTQPPEIGFFAPPGVDTVLATPPGTYLQLLEFFVDPVASAQVNAVARVTFSDLQRSWAVHVRRGVAEVTDAVPEKTDVAIELPRKTWARIALRELTLADAVAAGEAKVTGEEATMETIVNSFDRLPTRQPEPEYMHDH
jgi:alkyl sulfatase BDS1-like metallo-beta-lactamase superfamily hydrolase